MGVTGVGVSRSQQLVAKPTHVPAVLKERPSGPYGLVPMSLVL